MALNLKKRKRYLAGGWYPEDAAEIRRLAARWTEQQRGLGARAVMAPHAGWFFSGELAARALWSLGDCDTVAILGGHLGRGDPVLCVEDEGFDCTVRDAENDLALLRALKIELREVGIQEIATERDIDNSVEIIMPLAATRFPKAKLVWLRVPPDYKARELGSALMRAAAACGRKLCVVASTDLTHYGQNYGFMPHGVGEAAVAWVRDENDRGFIRAVMEMDADRALNHARDRFSACSPGAAAAAIAFALGVGARRALLLGHSLSYDVQPDRSFVGYAAIAFVE